ncbi:hypothetical protein [Paenibacillus sp. 8b26]
MGPIYPTISKDDAHAVQGPVILHKLRKAGIHVPIIKHPGVSQEL